MISMIYGFENDEIKDCHAWLELRLFFIGVIVMTSLIILNEIAIIYISMQGTLTDARPRHHMPIFLYIQLGLYLPELLWTILGTYWAVNSSSNCELSLTIAVWISVALEWCILLAVFIGVLVLFDPLGHVDKDPFGREFSSTMQQSAKEVCFAYSSLYILSYYLCPLFSKNEVKKYISKIYFLLYRSEGTVLVQVRFNFYIFL